MRAGRLGVARPAIQASNAVILFWVGPYRMGIDAAALKEIRNDNRLAEEASGCEAILSAHALLGVPAGSEGRLLVLRPGRVGVRVDRVERMIETGVLRSLPLVFCGAERAWYSGLILIGDTVCPMMNAETLMREARPLAPDVLASASVPHAMSQEATSS
jgi:hypothetical protein